uniref:Uncharacterized protein n=1 Tax=Glossina pallidipes TaxID=7398 RepID=A0A1A9ZAK3_GLOPL
MKSRITFLYDVLDSIFPLCVPLQLINIILNPVPQQGRLISLFFCLVLNNVPNIVEDMNVLMAKPHEMRREHRCLVLLKQSQTNACSYAHTYACAFFFAITAVVPIW